MKKIILIISALFLTVALILISYAQPKQMGLIKMYGSGNYPVNSESTTILDENIILLREKMFMGEGEMIRTGDDELDWYYIVFGGHGFNTIPMYVIDIAGHEAFADWRKQFTSQSIDGWRNPREANLRSFIDDLHITKEDIINTVELLYGMAIAEIDKLVTWARTIDIPAAPNDIAVKASFWMHQCSLSDIEALFSNDVYEVWAAYPGSGVIQDGKAYSPEWIMHNVDRAVREEQIPVADIIRIADRASRHPVLDDIRIEVEAFLQAVLGK